MTELKTLKDLKFIDERYLTGKTKINYDKFISQKEIKAEAIKWVKKINKLMKKKDHRFEAHMGAISFIITFFNLTEEDLK